MKTIWKFPLQPVDDQVVAGPGLRVISVGRDPSGQPCAWGTVDTEAPEVKSSIALRGTGNPLEINEAVHRFVGTILTGPLVWHIFAS